MKLEAKSRLLAWKPNPISKNSLWKHLLIDLQNFESTGDQVKGKVVRYSKEDQTWILYDVEDKKVAAKVEMNILTSKQTPQIFSAAVNPEYQGQGLGLAFYEYLLKHYKHLASSHELSRGSSKLWAALIKKHRGYIQVDLHKDVKVKVLGFKEHQGYQWPIVERDGQKVALCDVEVSGPEEEYALDHFIYIVEL